MRLLHAGLDIGSTTAKAVVLDGYDNVLFSRYTRHFADIRSTVERIVREITDNFRSSEFTISVAGSGALEMAEKMDIPFTQEQIACSKSIGRFLPGVDVSIELGGEDAKLTFFDKCGADRRMNETCAGGTGAFIDQMASLLGIDATGLNELAKSYRTIYPIASRCGVFAKTDIQPLLNDGASRSDIAASIFQAIVNQTISGLACGRRIKGNVAFLGGPLYFLSELRKRFTETLGLTEEQSVLPQNPHLYVAMGAALSAKEDRALPLDILGAKAHRFFISRRDEKNSLLPPLFANDAELAEFKARHAKKKAARRPAEGYRGSAYVGIDAGSTTLKAVLIGENGELLFSRYSANVGGESLKGVRAILTELYSIIPDGVDIAGSGVTGYGENLIKAAFGVDTGEVETVAHAKAAEFIEPDVDFLIDIGGQDMKCLAIKDGVIDRVFLNEACSSGCGSFLQTFAESLGMDIAAFAKEAELSASPVDLGSRCTVFMNSRVRQAQKEGASIRDISAGLVYSVVRNALYKVLKIRDVDDLGKHIVVQGGSFKNDALLRAFELITGREVIRPEIPELMGAFGAALLAKERKKEKSTFISRENLERFTAESSTFRCRGCGNACILTNTRFASGGSYVSGNRCERGSRAASGRKLPPNVFELKEKRLFDYYRPLPPDAAKRGSIGIPRVLNIYEDYPFWFTLLTELGFRVELSPAVADENLGIDTIPSQTVCYPAKLTHRHIAYLLESGVKNIFFPIMQKEKKEFASADKSFNCPVITGYPDVARLNIDGLEAGGVRYISPEINIESKRQVVRAVTEALAYSGVESREAEAAAEKAYAAQREYKKDVARFGDETAAYIKEHGVTGIVLAGHPYHLSPEVNHGIPAMINGYGVAVLTEDSVGHMADDAASRKELDVIDQWTFHSRLYRAAMAVAGSPKLENVEFVQLNSFGCGPDAISADQSADILTRKNKLHTLIKIDEGRNNGAVRIRIRSLLAAVEMRGKKKAGTAAIMRGERKFRKNGKVRTVLCPPLSSHHFQFMESAFAAEPGMRLEVLPEGAEQAVEYGLKYVNNDMCYPSLFVVGQFIEALKSGRYDPDCTDCLYAQTGGSCRASNYVHVLRRALDQAGFENVRVLAANGQGGRDAEKFAVSIGTYKRVILAILYGDMIMRLSLRTRPYEIQKGATNALCGAWKEKINEAVRRGRLGEFRQNLKAMARDFSAVPIDGTERPRVGIVGEILVKYHANANEHLVDIIEAEGGEAVVPDMANFILYCLTDPIYDREKLGGPIVPALIGQAGRAALEKLRAPMNEALRGSRFGSITPIDALGEKARGIVSRCNQAGEGWLLTAEMVHLLESGVKKILCIQPFACLPDHITGKGVIKELKRRYDGAGILALDYDASVSRVNQLNRIKLLMSVG